MTEQDRAHAAVAKAVRLGHLPSPRSLACADCAAPAIEYDHRDYSRPLEVQPVCRRCNSRRGPAKGHTRDGWGFVMVRATETEKRRLASAAKAEGFLQLAPWVRKVLADAAARAIKAAA